jgi:hypothetical protein
VFDNVSPRRPYVLLTPIVREIIYVVRGLLAHGRVVLGHGQQVRRGQGRVRGECIDRRGRGRARERHTRRGEVRGVEVEGGDCLPEARRRAVVGERQAVVLAARLVGLGVERQAARGRRAQRRGARGARRVYAQVGQRVLIAAQAVAVAKERRRGRRAHGRVEGRAIRPRGEHLGHGEACYRAPSTVVRGRAVVDMRGRGGRSGSNSRRVCVWWRGGCCGAMAGMLGRGRKETGGDERLGVGTVVYGRGRWRGEVAPVAGMAAYYRRGAKASRPVRKQEGRDCARPARIEKTAEGIRASTCKPYGARRFHPPVERCPDCDKLPAPVCAAAPLLSVNVVPQRVHKDALVLRVRWRQRGGAACRACTVA